MKRLLALIPPHKTYVEPFGGAAALPFAKQPSQVEVYNDIHGGVVNLYRVLRDETKFERFKRAVELMPYSREEFEAFDETWMTAEDDVERAIRFFVVARAAFSAQLYRPSWGYNVSEVTSGVAKVIKNYLASIERLPLVHERLRTVQIENDDFRRVIRRYDTSETFFYLDPPYVLATRRGGRYAHEMSDSDHEELVDMLLTLKGRAMLTGYANAIYKRLEAAGWRRIDYTTHVSAVGRVRTSGLIGRGAVSEIGLRVESVWLNYDPPALGDAAAGAVLAAAGRG
ncbi:MAG: DNA adenine methylase [Hydrogenibacillus schlegelii]|nr:DNA adenine methylase [Hydrogenibacillus schlegelii]